MLRTLNELRPGDHGRVEALKGPADVCASLRRLGLTEGAAVRCLRYCPLGGPGLYLVRGTALALRREEGRNIAVGSLSN